MSIKGYKGFNKDLQCRGFQYEIGKKYETETAKACESGFHFCENPLDVWKYYPITDSNRFTEVEGNGEISNHDDDSKIACSKIKIGAEINTKSMVSAAIKFIFEKTSATTGNSAHSATTGYSAHSATTGDSAHSAVTGKESIAAAIGVDSKAKGALNCWIILAEWVNKNDDWHIKSVKTAKVDGKKIKADTWYQLSGGKFVEVTDDDE